LINSLISLGSLLWLIHSNLKGRDFALIWWNGLFGSAGSAGCEWGRMENMCFYGLVDKFGLVDKYLLLLLMKRKRTWEEKNVCNERKRKCFPVLFKRKTLSFVKVMFSVLTRIQFPLTIFLYCCQTWENKESEFQEFTSLQSNTA